MKTTKDNQMEDHLIPNISRLRKQNGSNTRMYQMGRYLLGKALHLLTSTKKDENREFMNRIKENTKDDSYKDKMRLGKRNEKETYLPSNSQLNNVFRLKKSSSLSENQESMKRASEIPKKEKLIPNIFGLRNKDKHRKNVFTQYMLYR